MAPALSAAINEFLQWLELDRHASAGTVAAYRADMKRFAKYAGKHGLTRSRSSSDTGAMEKEP